MSATVLATVSIAGVAPDWRAAPPVLTGRRVTMRELELRDVPSLATLLATLDVARFISPPPTTVEGFGQFVRWARRERQRGTQVCFAVVPHGLETAVGLFQIRQLGLDFANAEWGFALGAPYWGTGLFVDGAELVLDFAFDVLGVTRLEARAAVGNGRGNGALRKIGAIEEAVLRQSLLCQGQYVDQTLWSILESDWRQAKVAWDHRIRVH